MRYLLLLQTSMDGLPERGTAEADQMYAAYKSAIDAMAEAGVLLECAPLAAASLATTVRVRDGEMLLTDGPAAEIREQVGGYAVLDCADLDDALKWASRIPSASYGSVEVRAIVDTR